MVFILSVIGVYSPWQTSWHMSGIPSCTQQGTWFLPSVTKIIIIIKTVYLPTEFKCGRRKMRFKKNSKIKVVEEMRCANLPCISQWTWSPVRSFPGPVQWCHPICFVCCKSPDNPSSRFSLRSSLCSCGFLCQSVRIRLLCRNTQQYRSQMAVVPGYQTTLFNRFLIFMLVSLRAI